MKNSTLKSNTKRLGETVLIALVALVGTGWIATQVLGTTHKGVDAQKKIELTQLASAIKYYNFDNNTFPKEPSGNGFCKIDTRYEGKKCLVELVVDGYVETLPVSINNEAYWYLIYSDYVAVGSGIETEEEISEANRCVLPNGFEFWCVKIKK